MSRSDFSRVLAIETSCDETAVAIATGSGDILASEISSQIAIHQPHGGVVPELASRNHNLHLRPLIAHTLDIAGVAITDLDAIAATAGPGLASSLLVGNTTAKAMALALERPFHAINHLEGHLLSPFIEKGAGIDVPSNLALVVSGGHTLIVHIHGAGDYAILGSTRDDAAGEAFDKVGKMLGLPYPGGPEIERRAREGDPVAFDFPRSMIDSGDSQFSFSGLKTAVFYQLRKLAEPLDETTVNDLCASFQEAVIEVLAAKTIVAARQTGEKLVTVSGGVSCNRRLREAMTEACEHEGLELRIAAPEFTTDNAAMIAWAAAIKQGQGADPTPLDCDIDPNLALV